MTSVIQGDADTALQWIANSPFSDTRKDLLRRFVSTDLDRSADNGLADEILVEFAPSASYPLAIWIASRLDANDAAIALLNQRLDDGRLLQLQPLWTAGADLWRDPGFLPLMERINLLDYWTANDWNDFCRPDGGQVRCDDAALSTDDTSDAEDVAD